MVERMANDLIEDGATHDKRDAVRCLFRRGCYKSLDIAHLVDDASRSRSNRSWRGRCRRHDEPDSAAPVPPIDGDARQLEAAGARPPLLEHPDKSARA
jgi:hypothetical protein